ncbi:hypothetical protein ERO13_A04G035001v2 [Gossypium hirsutum]|uniref:Uncharacterized protein n=1 Tax=Gossypium mustelinum TaxID=34275 RepID=A0A5D2ZKM6_GOSMU|nr:hypothetical protein ERO13_A04G035001v2 [Gossypium hirsutum]TYJ39102.1 hypothetical protein E1A91_A04G043200v1 [Gossypium mustelinum]
MPCFIIASTISSASETIPSLQCASTNELYVKALGSMPCFLIMSTVSTALGIIPSLQSASINMVYVTISSEILLSTISFKSLIASSCWPKLHMP